MGIWGLGFRGLGGIWGLGRIRDFEGFRAQSSHGAHGVDHRACRAWLTSEPLIKVKLLASLLSFIYKPKN